MRRTRAYFIAAIKEKLIDWTKRDVLIWEREPEGWVDKTQCKGFQFRACMSPKGFGAGLLEIRNTYYNNNPIVCILRDKFVADLREYIDDQYGRRKKYEFNNAPRKKIAKSASENKPKLEHLDTISIFLH